MQAAGTKAVASLLHDRALYRDGGIEFDVVSLRIFYYCYNDGAWSGFPCIGALANSMWK